MGIDTTQNVDVALFWARVGQMNADVRKYDVIIRLYYLGHDVIARALRG